MMAMGNPWGAERIRGELLKLGITVSKRTIQKYMHQVRKPSAPSGQRWSTFLENHIGDIWACDFLQLHDAMFRPVFAFFVIDHGRRDVLHFNATHNPTAAWVIQQLREAFPYDTAPKYLICDRDAIFCPEVMRCIKAMGTTPRRIAYRSPW